MTEKFIDGEVLGKDADGCLILWDGEHGSQYNCGETLEQFGKKNLTPIEKDRLGGIGGMIP